MKVKLLAAGLAMVAGGTALAYEWTGVKWSLRNGQSVSYKVSESLSGDVMDRDALEGINLGYDVWTALPCSYMAWSYEGRTPITAWGAADGNNVSSWRESAWNDSAAALGIATYISGGGGIQDCDIKFNGQDHSWIHHPADFNGGGFGGRVDIASVATHEAGHCIGLGHSDVNGATMWPTVLPGIESRSLSADDIQGGCEIYANGGEVPDPGDPPPPLMGTVEFGGDCSSDRCVAGLFCVSDGREMYCTRACEPAEDNACGDGFYCAQLSGGDGACAKGEDPNANRAAFGENCGEDIRCDQGLECVSDEGQLYCTGPCLNDSCPTDFFCTQLEGGRDICARGDEAAQGPLPVQGQSCSDRGLCADDLFCLNDQLNVDEETGAVVPYCTTPCPEGMCGEGYRCMVVRPNGSACQKIPSAGERNPGDPCWSNPEDPDAAPTCGAAPNFCDMETMTCSMNCDSTTCCPDGWGCIELLPTFGVCKEGATDNEGFECSGGDGGGGAGGGAGGDGAGDGGEGGESETPKSGGGGGGGCSVSSGPAPAAPLGLLFGVFGLLGLARSRRRS